MEKIEEVALDQLLLDKENPRIYQDNSDSISQLKLAKFIFDNFGIFDLKDSFLKFGYFQVEPMIIIPSDNIKDKYIVIEGNRRLTTIKILCEKEYREKIVSIGRQDDYIASEELKKKLKSIPVLIKKIGMK